MNILIWTSRCNVELATENKRSELLISKTSQSFYFCKGQQVNLEFSSNSVAVWNEHLVRHVDQSRNCRIRDYFRNLLALKHAKSLPCSFLKFLSSLFSDAYGLVWLIIKKLSAASVFSRIAWRFTRASHSTYVTITLTLISSLTESYDHKLRCWSLFSLTFRVIAPFVRRFTRRSDRWDTKACNLAKPTMVIRKWSRRIKEESRLFRANSPSCLQFRHVSSKRRSQGRRRKKD